ncbi:MAG: MASE1 domain-containing protein [Streptosporangiales bacterium]|nr:MASE1 domain-containing protein [Streptosporangiales bacterium]MBO0890806.1 MASE1 domain-containing protein [Acidothermales bacterium]
MVAGSSGWRRAAVFCGWALVVAAGYYTAARIGLPTALVDGQVTPLWPPTGVALVVLCWLGPRALPGIALGAFLVNVTLGPSLPAVLVITVGNTLAPAASYLLLRLTGFHVELDRFKDVLGLVFLGAFVGMSISAAVGSAALVFGSGLSPAHFVSAASVWWTGDAMGVLTITPLLLVVRAHPWRVRVRPARWAEAVVLVAVTSAVTFLVMSSAVDLMFLIFPFLIWSALRFQLFGGAVCALIVSVFAVRAAVVADGPFAGLDLTAKMITLQAFNGSVALTTLLLAAITAARNRAQRSLEQAGIELDRLMHVLGPATTLSARLRLARSQQPEPDDGQS